MKETKRFQYKQPGLNVQSRPGWRYIFPALNYYPSPGLVNGQRFCSVIAFLASNGAMRVLVKVGNKINCPTLVWLTRFQGGAMLRA